MTVAHIADPADERLADYRGVSDAKLLRERNLFVAEGRLVVERVLGDPRYTVESLLLNQAAFNALQPALTSLQGDHSGTPVFVCDTSVFEPLTGYNIHRGCLALVRRPPAANWRGLVATARLVVVLEGVTDADNVGSVFRNAAAFGADAVLLSPSTCDPLYRKAMRTSMGSALRVPFARVEPWPQSIEFLRESQFAVVALSPNAPAITLDQFIERCRGHRLVLAL